ncbi:MAG TPA: bifunctional phosphoribosylaminoimidazolecarboxamide formyltransferase/IMP cyclohydrolase, partial [Gemmatimonadaceae bacterium]|nr:bifunctional phosphoribosylaminoimidazolecarboxamide formyltransferase/IMP cyclohydrolase [Gemmatimonadaceae bacterium]
MPVAILSVHDKSGILPFATELQAMGWELVSTGGTAAVLRQAGIAVREVADLTGFPEMLDGRVKTLHPVVHGGILARRDSEEHMAAIAAAGIAPIDLVAVNLYPFRKTAARPGATYSEVVEQIDIGGPAMIRSAAKNHASVWCVVDPSDYSQVIAALHDGNDPSEFRRQLAEKAFAHTAAYDAAIASWFAAQRGDMFPPELVLPAKLVQKLRYGENPGQRAAFYADDVATGLAALRQVSGKELSFNNLADLDGALMALDPFADRCACAIVKHTTPCGLALGDTPLEAYRKALECDPVSAFGSVVALNVPVDRRTAEAISTLFVECIVAPSFTPDALDLLQQKKNLRILEGQATWPRGAMDIKRVRGGLLLQERPPGRIDDSSWVVVTKRSPSASEYRDLLFAWRAVASVKSNAIVLARGEATIGIGAGQMSRVDASFLAVHKARQAGHDPQGSVMGSDAFFPFRDAVDQAAAAGVTA